MASTACQLSSAGKVAHTQTKIKIKTRGDRSFFFSFSYCPVSLSPIKPFVSLRLHRSRFHKDDQENFTRNNQLRSLQSKGNNNKASITRSSYFHNKQRQQMSKRGTENQLTKDEYDRDGDNDEGSSIQGVFKQASQEEMAKRV